jgi:hypothetical protein
LKPNLDLSLGQMQYRIQFDSSWSTQVTCEMKLFLQLDQLSARVSCASSFRRLTVEMVSMMICLLMMI